MAQKKKPHLNLVVIGHVDHGKSTLMGHVLYLTGFVDERTIKEYEEQAKRLGRETWKFAWILDRYKEERERGLTIDLGFYKFETNKYEFTIIDAPGHRDFVKNMVTGASQADAALLVVSAKEGEYEAGISPAGQTREHVFLAKTMGINQLVVAINKMDTVDYNQERYNEVKEGISRLLKMVGYKVDKIAFVPVSGLYGDNIIKPSEKTPWYKGPTLIEALDMFEEPERPIDKPLRIPIQDVYTIKGVGTVPVGRVETGVLKVGDRVIFMPPKIVGEVKSIETHHVRIEQAIPGDNIGFNVKGVSKDQIRRGDVAGHTDNPPTVAEEFVGRIFVLYHPTAIAAGYTPVLHIHTATVPVRFVALEKKLDPRTGSAVEENPAFIKQGDAAIVRLKPLKHVVIEKYSELPQLGRFAIRDSGRTVAAGTVIEVKKVE
ncbi:MAG: translation elongation factor EF-1 subunit alpha [Thermoprotei archaeon]|nr:translation elongation factor EF-1 subunit alpha [Thermoproteales archaeon]RLE75388.1 MAG: translation elongation factor EF-1 subunit alpha [Thermoprotei archaeon]RLE85951.1 MAG: translation elongation factor EF-1 subunit alpha [Thermoprotei archaeon]